MDGNGAGFYKREKRGQETGTAAVRELNPDVRERERDLCRVCDGMNMEMTIFMFIPT